DEEEAIKIWDCGSPLYDSYELVAVTNVIERHFMILPGSTMVATHQLCLTPGLISPSSMKPAADTAAAAASGNAGKSSVLSFLSELVEGRVWKRKMDAEGTKQGKKQKIGIFKFFHSMKSPWKK
ncbi:hypothetical protein Pfo_005916, partial [Paulownia fortunei]